MPRPARPPWEPGLKGPAPLVRVPRVPEGRARAPRAPEARARVRRVFAVRAAPVRAGAGVRVRPARAGAVAPGAARAPALAARGPVPAARAPVPDLRPPGSARLSAPARAPARWGCPPPRARLLFGPRALGPRANPPIHPERDPARVAEPNCPPQSPDSVSPAAWRVYSGHRMREAS